MTMKTAMAELAATFHASGLRSLSRLPEDAQRTAGRAAMISEPLGSDPWVPAAYAGEQPWTRDPRGSRVQCYSPRIPHGKATKWQSTHIRPCQGAIIG